MGNHPESTSVPRSGGDGRNSASHLLPPVRRLPAVTAKLQVDPRMIETSDTSDTPDKPQDYTGSRAELATLVDDFTPLINELWPRLEDHKYRWELHSYGPPGIRQARCHRHRRFADRRTQGHRRHRQQAHTGSHQSRPLQPQQPRHRLIKRHLVPQCLTSRSAE
jgi:hypothetical protein